ncbi:MAG: FtsH protease activity modulator HflK [Spirochaetes bacterium]|nr:FtsH protease activity modulator HflK [Spirochaetota bacterium]
MSERDVTPGNFPIKLSPKVLWLIIIVVLALVVAFSSIYTVDQKAEAVILRFGKFNRIAGPGLHYKLPFGIEKNFNVPVQRVLKEEFGFRTVTPGITTIYSSQDYPQESVMLTGDLNIVDVEWIIQYRISNPREWLFNVVNQRKTIRDISQSVINQLVGDRTVLDVIGGQRATIESMGQQMMNDVFNKYQLGIRVTTVKLQNVVPPKGDVQNAFEDVNKAIQDRSRLINEGKEAYNQAIPKAQGEAQRVIQQAEGYATQRVNRSQGDVHRFLSVLAEYEKNPKVTRTRLYYEMYENVFKDAKSVDLIDKNLKNFVPFKSIGSSLQGVQK